MGEPRGSARGHEGFHGEVFWGADRHIRRGGSGVEWGRLRRPRPAPVRFPPPARATQASPHNPSPAPTGTKELPRRCYYIPPRVRTTRVPAHNMLYTRGTEAFFFEIALE